MPTFNSKKVMTLETEASYNDIDITGLNHDSDYNSKSIIIHTEESLDELNKTFFETLNDFKVNYVKYYLDKFETCLEISGGDLIDTSEISKMYDNNKIELDDLYDELLYLKYRILINILSLFYVYK